jgi:hypothetical protein
MGYMQDVDRWLGELLADFADNRLDIADLHQAFREKLLESYRNGQAAGQRPQAGKGRTDKPTYYRHGR